MHAQNWDSECSFPQSRKSRKTPFNITYFKALLTTFVTNDSILSPHNWSYRCLTINKVLQIDLNILMKFESSGCRILIWYLTASHWLGECFGCGTFTFPLFLPFLDTCDGILPSPNSPWTLTWLHDSTFPLLDHF